MAITLFDTLTASKDLQQAGFEKSQAEAIAMVIKQSEGDLVTKHDIALLKSDIALLNTGIDQLRSELKIGISQLKSEIRYGNN